MSFRAKLYWLAVVGLGLSVSYSSFVGWHPASQEIFRLCVYALAGVLSSAFKLPLPGLFSTLSINYVFIIAGLLDLHLPGAVAVGIASVAGQVFIRARFRPKWIQAIFNVAAISLPITAANALLQLHFPREIDRLEILPVVIASFAYFAVSTCIVAGIIALTSDRSPLAVWHENYWWSSPQYLVGGVIAGCFHVVLGILGWMGVLFVVPVIYLIYHTYQIYLTRVEEQQKHIIDMAQLHLRTIETLALAIDAKDDTTAAHLRRVQIYASAIGKELQLSPIEMQALEAAALLHDIGKLAVPEYIVSKPGRLTPDEFEKMKIHPVVGAEILERVHFPYPVVPIVRSHHEKFDGTGYPDGLAGEEIPIGARILSAVDCLDALASNRQYRTAMPLDDAMGIVARDSGRAFDPRVVDCLLRRYRELEAKARAESGEPAKISSHIRVERGASPATGFAQSSAPVLQTMPSGDHFRMAISDARREFQTLVEITNDLGSSLSMDETLALLAVRLEKAIDYDAVAIYIRQGGELVPKFVKGESFRLFSSLRIPMGQGISGWVAENDRAIVNGNPAVEPGYLNDSRKVTTLRSAIAVPLRGRNGVIGVLTLYHLQAEAFTADHRRLLVNISKKAGLAIENSIHFQHAQSEAQTDELTGLWNAKSLFRHLEEQVAGCIAEGNSMAVVVMDLDGFKSANDQHGHLAGNRVLQSVAKGLRDLCGAADLAARMGGDEFVMVVRDPGDGLPALLREIEALGARAAAEAGCGTAITISAGVAEYPKDAHDAENLLEKADERMYEDKRSRRKLAA